MISESYFLPCLIPAKVSATNSIGIVAAYWTIERIAGSQLDEVCITNTIPLSEPARACGKIRQLSVAFLFAETIRRISDGESVTSLFSEQNSNF